jgi:hypothetical protein
MMNTTMDREWRLWQEVVRLLKSTGAVTEEDCSGPVRGGPITPGTELFDAIRCWGEAKAKLSIDVDAGIRAEAKRRARAIAK